ncbi:hypothetical protein PIB30_057959 [Stylosanthes scabra]|uniref:Uncharacterized protein n=1 Tax=Stylosanthes scabra TaxID=79078 RepID=A0ABU6ZII1_9FABA|nr:hypothetical protein [Stylosanthes scabra]
MLAFKRNWNCIFWTYVARVITTLGQRGQVDSTCKAWLVLRFSTPRRGPLALQGDFSTPRLDGTVVEGIAKGCRIGDSWKRARMAGSEDDDNEGAEVGRQRYGGDQVA